MVHLIVGYGEVGKAIHKVVGQAFYVDKKKVKWDSRLVDIVHICIPYDDTFKQVVEFYKTFGRYTVVHSTVPLGTCDALDVIHSPIRGVHPHLEKGIRTFVKYFGGKDSKKVARIFKRMGIRTRSYPDARTTEALKLWDTTQYGRLIMLEKEIHAYCQKHNLDFKAVYTQANKDYNEGYTKLGMGHVVRPYLKHVDGPIGGHCVVPNSKLLKVKL